MDHTYSNTALKNALQEEKKKLIPYGLFEMQRRIKSQESYWWHWRHTSKESECQILHGNNFTSPFKLSEAKLADVTH